VIVSRIGLRGVFQYCVTRYLIVWTFLGALPFSSTVLAVSENMTFECKRSRSRKARQSSEECREGNGKWEGGRSLYYDYVKNKLNSCAV
jgi:hypothetical protein